MHEQKPVFSLARRFIFVLFSQIRVVNAFRSSLYETPHYKRSMNSLQSSIHDFLPYQSSHYGDDDDDDLQVENQVPVEPASMTDENKLASSHVQVSAASGLNSSADA